MIFVLKLLLISGSKVERLSARHNQLWGETGKTEVETDSSRPEANRPN